jgi:hypothetical protein
LPICLTDLLGRCPQSSWTISAPGRFEDIIVKLVNEHLAGQHNRQSSSADADDRGVMIAKLVVRIDVHRDRLIVRFKSAGTEEESHSTDGQLLSILWQKPPSSHTHAGITLGEPGIADTMRPTQDRSVPEQMFGAEKNSIDRFSSTCQLMLPTQSRSPILLRRVRATCPLRAHERFPISPRHLERLAAPDRRAGWCRH